MNIKTDYFSVTPQDGESFLNIDCPQANINIKLAPPVFEIGGKLNNISALKFKSAEPEQSLKNGGKEIKLIYEYSDELILYVFLRYFPDSPVIRFKYEISADKEMQLTKAQGKDNLRYTGISINTEKPELTEIQFSQFLQHMHAFVPCFDVKRESELAEGCNFPGPIAIIEQDDYCTLLAYEHGAELPDCYLSFETKQSNGLLQLHINAEKGNYFNGEKIGNGKSFHSTWFQFALCKGKKEDMLKHYRKFMLEYICENSETRKPYIFYNTWNYQERNNYYNGKNFLDSMNYTRMMQEIDIAHKIGIDVFVIDTGWYSKTGDWLVNLEKFPDGLKDIKKKLDGYGMKLGLWFNPTRAARTSEIISNHPEYIMTEDGESSCYKIWETEESYGVCLASDYSDYYIKRMIELYRELGVTYFKWDGVEQCGCNSPLHNHGNENNTPGERDACFKYKMGMEMVRIAEEITKQCPGAIVDFDVTERGRFFGLGFLSAGKLFSVNNGPYAFDLDIPENYIYKNKEPYHIEPYTNIFFYPGVARPRFCRQGIKYDNFIPSVVFLTHYLLDPPELSQNNSLASLMLGGNGVWGDLLSLSDKDIQLFSDTLKKYKSVAEYVTTSYPIVKGVVGSSPEIYEKIDHKNAKGIICFFTSSPGSYTYITEKINTEKFTKVENADDYILTPDGRLKITVNLNKDEAKIIFVN